MDARPFPSLAAMSCGVELGPCSIRCFGYFDGCFLHRCHARHKSDVPLLQTPSSATASTRPTCASPTTRRAPAPGHHAIGRRAAGLARVMRAPCPAAAGDCQLQAARAPDTSRHQGIVKDTAHWLDRHFVHLNTPPWLFMS